MKTVGLLLAAGQSRRFGPTNKLLAALNGKPLVAHAAEKLLQLSLTHKVAIVAADDVAAVLTKFEIIRVDGEQNDMAQNIAAGVRLATDRDADKVLIALGDMPFVTKAHFEALLRENQSGGPMASSNGNIRMPPACFPRPFFAQLVSLRGDKGAAHIIRELPDQSIIAASPEELKDVDFSWDISDASNRI